MVLVSANGFSQESRWLYGGQNTGGVWDLCLGAYLPQLGKVVGSSTRT